MKVQRVLGLGAWRDAPTYDKRRFGVPPGGPWDVECAKLVRALLSLPDDQPVFELLRGTAEFEFEEAGTVAIVGTDGVCMLAGAAVPMGCRSQVAKGSHLTVRSNLAYFAFRPSLLSACRLERLPVAATTLRYLPIAEGIGERTLIVDPTCSRAGVRLNGLYSEPVADLPSEPSCVGAIQRTSSGQVIVIGPDGPTIGGYPKIGTVIEADLDLVARLLPRASVRLVPVSWEMARAMDVKRIETLGKATAILRATALD